LTLLAATAAAHTELLLLLMMMPQRSRGHATSRFDTLSVIAAVTTPPTNFTHL